MTILVCPLSAAGPAARKRAPSHLVSLLAPPAKLPPLQRTFKGARLHLAFNDIAEARPGLVAPSAAHMADLLEFLATWDRRSTLLIHCWAGVSRSTAAGYIAASLRDGAGSEADLAAALRAAAPYATPNPLLIALADEALGRGGAMSAAIAAIGRGEDVSEGRLFEL